MLTCPDQGPSRAPRSPNQVLTHAARAAATSGGRVQPLVATSGGAKGSGQSNAPRTATEWLCSRAARAACVSTWLGEDANGRQISSLPNVVRPCCREAAALPGARHAKRGGAARLPQREIVYHPSTCHVGSIEDDARVARRAMRAW